MDDRQGEMHAKCSVCDVLPRSGCRASLQRASFNTKRGADPTHQSKLDSLVEPGGERRSAKQSITSAVVRVCCKACERRQTQRFQGWASSTVRVSVCHRGQS